MSVTASWAIVAGLGLGLGLWLVVSRLPRMSSPHLTARIAPFVTDVSRDAYELVNRARSSHPLMSMGFAPLIHRTRTFVLGLFGSSTVLEQRLTQAGTGITVERFRFEQLGCALTATVATAIVTQTVPAFTTASPAVHLALPLVAACLGFLAREQLLRRRIARRARRIRAELPTIMEFLALSVSAGEGLRDAIGRVAQIGRGELSQELAGVTIETTAGVTLHAALKQLASNLNIASVTRAVDAITAALERGSPVADVLRAHASDARESAKNDLLEMAGKKELAMLVPLIFLILPVTVLFAIYPGIFVLEAGFGT